MNREETLQAAASAVMGERDTQYGNPEDNFNNIAMMWSNYTGNDLNAYDVAMMMALLKIVRAKGNASHEDNMVDLAGYAACANEIAENWRNAGNNLGK
jgi:predicted cobalt transporter CbtA